MIPGFVVARPIGGALHYLVAAAGQQPSRPGSYCWSQHLSLATIWPNYSFADVARTKWGDGKTRVYKLEPTQ